MPMYCCHLRNASSTAAVFCKGARAGAGRRQGEHERQWRLQQLRLIAWQLQAWVHCSPLQYVEFQHTASFGWLAGCTGWLPAPLTFWAMALTK